MKTIHFAILIGLCSLVFGISKADDGRAQIERFQVFLQQIDQAMPPGANAKSVLNSVLGAGVRVSAFHLQALGKIYSSQNETFKELKEDFKDLEDGIGTYDKWNSLYIQGKAAGAKKEILEKLERKSEKAKADLVQLLEERKWVNPGGRVRTQRMREWLGEYKWSGYSSDRKFVLSRLISQTAELDQRKWDLSYLEKDNGLHELRRELRWLAIEVRALNGAIQFAPHNNCPVPAYANLIGSPLATSKYAQLAKGPLEIQPCFIPQCVFLGFAKYINILGEIKDQAERRINLGANDDRTPGDLLPKANALLQELKATGLLRVFAENLNRCQP